MGQAASTIDREPALLPPLAQAGRCSGCADQQIDLKKKDGATVDASAAEREVGNYRARSATRRSGCSNNVASSLSPVTADSTVDDKPTDLGKYGLNNPSLTVTVDEKNGKTDKLFFGDDVPAGSLVYARVNSDPKVYAVVVFYKNLAR